MHEVCHRMDLIPQMLAENRVDRGKEMLQVLGEESSNCSNALCGILRAARAAIAFASMHVLISLASMQQ